MRKPRLSPTQAYRWCTVFYRLTRRAEQQLHYHGAWLEESRQRCWDLIQMGLLLDDARAILSDP